MDRKKLANYKERNWIDMNKYMYWFCLLSLWSCHNSSRDFREYFEDGVLKVEGKYINNLREGDWYIYDFDGDTTYIKKYSRDSLINQISFANNIRISSTQYQEDTPHGHYEVYYESGEVECEGYLKEGNSIGIDSCYFQDGSLKRTIDNGNGHMAGEFIQYYHNGNIQLHTKVKGEGEHTHYDSLGNLGWKIIFKESVPQDTLEFNFSAFPN